MSNELEKALVSSLSSDKQVRENSEATIQHIETTYPECAFLYAQLLASSTVDQPIRQASGLALKKYISSHWSAVVDNYCGPTPDPEIKAKVRELAFNTLSDPNFKIRTIAAYVVTSLAHFDWPEDWPNFVELLMLLIQNGDKFGVHGALRAFAEFTDKDLSDQQVSTIGPVIFPELLKVVTSPDSFSAQSRIYAIEIFHNFITMVEIMKDADPQLPERLLASTLGSWVEYLLNNLRDPSVGPVELGLKVQSITALQKVLTHFPSHLPSLAGLADLVVENLKLFSDLYVQAEVKGELVDQNAVEELETVKVESLIYLCLEVLSSLSLRKDFNKTSFTKYDLSYWAWLAITYAQVTADQLDLWQEDPNCYLNDENDETLNFSVRIAAKDLLSVLVSTFDGEALVALSKAIKEHLATCDQQRQANDPYWWTIAEACLNCVGYLSFELSDHYEQSRATSKPVLLDVQSLIDTVALPLLDTPDLPMAQGGALIFTSLYADILPPQSASQCLGRALTAMATSTSILVNLSGLKAINNFCTLPNKEILVPALPNIFEATLAIAHQVNGEVLILLLETWSAAIKVNPETSAKYAPALLPKIVDLWVKVAQVDAIAADVVKDTIQSLAEIPSIYMDLISHLVPGLVNHISNPSTPVLATTSAVDILCALADVGPSPLPANLVASTFPALLQNHSDPELLVAIQDYFQTVANKDLDQVVNWQYGGQSGLSYIVKFIANLITLGDSTCFAVGDLILALLLKNTSVLEPYLSDILIPLVQRLAITQLATTRQTLIIVLAQLCRTHLVTILDFLSKPVGEVQNPLSLVVNLWLEHHDSFCGYFQIKLSAFALTQLLVKNDPRINQILVKGDLIDINPGRIVTRSQTRKVGEQYTSILANLKIVKLIVNDYINDVYAQDQRNLNPADVDDDDEWADVDEEGNYLSEQLDKVGNRVAQEEDILYESDPLYNYDLKSYHKEVLRQLVNTQVVDLNGLDAREKLAFEAILQS